ncbi:Avr9/Cf-9 rapidly elicited protein [Quillaja saponaria]|uniref:Avr9/Cf-9 rapidly elicited protein n=1 Tax=Quillaja saponaria TaxID=32244 RepID=A0AAD7LGQ8_QUISA|nr:Avr9/Cf-9 rapidly elicited protein [Quillaja saponaria]
MNSLFSSFDAVCTEFLGKKATASGFFTTQNRFDLFLSKSKPTDHSVNPKEQGGSSPPPSSKPPSGNVRKQQSQRQSQRAAPRFALELDGLNCFETLVSL